MDPLSFRRSLRRDLPDGERKLWDLLRNRHLGAKFRRQHTVGPYVLDFYCPTARLAIEADGRQHFEAPGLGADALRTAFLESRGIRVLRFTNREILGETGRVRERIRAALLEDRSPLTPQSRTVRTRPLPPP